MKKKILIGFCIFFAITVIGGYIFLRSPFFTGKLHLAMESVLQKRLGREVSVGKVTGNVFGSISVAGISVAKDKKLSEGKFIEVDEVTAGYSLLSLLKWRFVIKSIRVARPRIWLERDEEGNLNLPKFAAGDEEGEKREEGEGRREEGGGKREERGGKREEGKKRSWFSVLVSNVDISSGTITFDDRENSIHSVVSGINGRLKGLGREMEYSGEITARKIELDFGAISKTISNLASSFETSEERLKLSDLQFQLGSSHLQAKGEITGWDKRIPHKSPHVSAELRSKLFLEDVSEFLLQGRTQGSPIRLDGVAEIYGVVSGKMPDLAGTCRIDLPTMRVNDLQVQNVNAEVKLTSRMPDAGYRMPDTGYRHLASGIRLSAELAGGSTGRREISTLSLQGTIQLADGELSKYDGVLKLDHLDVGEVITGLNGSQAGMPVPLSGYLSGEVSVDGTEFRAGSLIVDARCSMEESRVEYPESSIELGTVEASLSVEGESVALNVSRDRTDVELEGKLGEDGELDLSVEMDGLDAGEITSLLTGSPSIVGEGYISADIGMKIVQSRLRAGMGLPPVEGQRAEREEGRGKREEGKEEEGRRKGSMLPGVADLRARVNIDMPDLHVASRVSGEEVQIGSLSGTINLIDDRLRVDEMVLQLGESECLLAAQVQVKAPPLIDARLSIDSLQIEDYLGLVWEPDKSGNYVVGGRQTQDSGRTRGSPLRVSGGVVNGELVVHGESTDMSGRGEFSVTGLSVGHRDIDPISIPIDIESSILTIPGLVVSSAGEQITTACRISPSGDFNLQVDSSPIDVSKLYGQISNVPVQDALPIRGAAQISLSGSGTLSSPSVHGKLKLNRLGYKGEDFGNGDCTFALRDERLHVNVSLLEQTLIATLDGSIQHPFPFRGIIQLGNIDLEPALNLAGLGEKIDLHIAGSIDVDGEGANPMDSSVDAICQTILLDAGGYRWMNEAAVEFGYNDGKAWVSQAKMKGAGGQFSVGKGEFDRAGAVDLDVAVEKFDLVAVSGLLNLPEPVIGRMDCMLRMQGEIGSPSIEVALDASGVSYEQVDVDGISARISYEKGMMRIERSVFNAFGGEVRIGAMLPLDLDLRNVRSKEQRAKGKGQERKNSMLYALSSVPIYASLDAEDLNLSSIPLFVPQVLTSGGEVDDVHLEMTGSMMQPKIAGLLKLKDAHFQLASLPAPIENLNGNLELVTRNASPVTGYEASLKLNWEMEEGRYDAEFSMLDTGCWMLDAWHRVLGVEHQTSNVKRQASVNGQPDFQFDLEVRDGQLGSLVKEMAKDPSLAFDGTFSGKLHLENKGRGGGEARERASEYSLTWSFVPILHDLRGDLAIDSLNLTVNGHKIKHRGQLKISLADGTLEISDLRLLTLPPPVGDVATMHTSPAQVGSIAASGKINMDETFELNLSGEHLHPGLFSSFLYRRMGSGTHEPVSASAHQPISPSPSGDLVFDIHAEGKLDSPAIALSLTAEDLTLPMPSANGGTEIDRILCKTHYSDGILNMEEVHIDTFGNSLDINGTLPASVSLMPFEVELPDQEMDLRMVMHNFDLAFLDHFTDEIEEVKGNAEADIRMLGSLKDPRLIGKFQLSDASCRLMVGSLKTSVQPDVTDEPQPIEIENIGLNVTVQDTGFRVPDAGISNPVSGIRYDMTFQIGEGRYETHGRMDMGQGLEPQLFDLAFKAAPAKIDPFLCLVGQDLSPSVSGEIMVDAQLKGDARELRGKPVLDTLKAISGEILIPDEGIEINAAEYAITNPKRIYAKLQDGKLDLPSLKLVHKIPALVDRDQSLVDRGKALIPPARASSIAAFGFWEIGGEKSFDAIVDLDMGLASELITRYASRVARYGWVQPDLMTGRLRFKVQARGQEVQCSWSPAGAGAAHVSPVYQGFTIGYASIDRFEGKVIYREQEIYVEEVRILSGENEVILRGKMPVPVPERHTPGKMELRVDAQLGDMGILSFLSRDVTESSGSGLVGVTITGDMQKVMAKEETVQFVGFCTFDDLNVNFDRSYINFEDLEADLEFDSEKLGANKGFIALKTLSGKMNGGEFFLDVDRIGGSQPGTEIIWEKETGYRIGELRGISITMRDCELYSPMVYSTLFDGEVTLEGKFDAPIITGNITVKRGEYTESLEDLVQRLFSSREIGFRAFLNYPLVQDLELDDLDVQVPGGVRLNNSIAIVETKAAAKVRGSLSKPVILAQAQIEGGFTYFGREFAITKGQITNRSTIDPEYDITAETEITNTGDLDTAAETLTVQMQLKGSLYEPLPPTFTILGGGLTQGRSNLSQKDIIAILTLGSTPEAFLDNALSGGPSPLLMEPARWYFEAKAEQFLDLKEFQIQRDPNAYKETRLVVAKQLMDEISVTADVGYIEQWIGLQYEVRKHFALGGEVNREGEWDFDLKIKWDFP